MATNNESGGLLTKMVKLIRGQPENATRPGSPEQTEDSEYNKSALQERIERKRQDDIVRRREFNHLRTLRKSSPLFTGSTGTRSSTFQNSTGFDRKGRALTVKKIDDIEATMSKHWLERKPAAGDEGTDENPTTEAPLRKETWRAPKVSAPVAKATAPAPAAGSAPAKLAAAMDALELTPFDEYDFTKMAASTEPVAPATVPVATKVVVPSSSKPVPPPKAPAKAFVDSSASIATRAVSTAVASKSTAATPPAQPAPKPDFKNSNPSRWDAGVSVFSSSEMGSLEMGTGLASANLREAAICFAEGDVAGAQEVLRNALSTDSGEHDLVQGYCVALLDLYRATGQRAPFEAAAIDYAERYGKSAPEWFSIPELLGRNTASVSGLDASARPVIARQIVWECPATLDVLAMKALCASLALNDLPKQLSWAGLKTIETDAAKELAELFAHWCAQKIELHFAGVQALIDVLKGYTPSSDMRVDPLWWQLRLDALRILGMRYDFETVALDFCVLYEVSPASWKDAVCVCVHELMENDAPGSAFDSMYTTLSLGLDMAEAAVLELSGEILGDSVPALDQLQKECESVEVVVISCARLIRVDFIAAGNILNWVAQRQAAGVHVQFSDVPPLVGAFFSVIGIDEHAAVVLRMR